MKHDHRKAVQELLEDITENPDYTPEEKKLGTLQLISLQLGNVLDRLEVLCVNKTEQKP